MAIQERLSKEEIVEYLYDYFLNVLHEDPPQAAEDWPLARDVLRLLLALRSIPPQDFKVGPFSKDAAFGYDPEWQTLWMQRAARITLPGQRKDIPVREVDAFYSGKLFTRKCVNAVRTNLSRKWQQATTLPTSNIWRDETFVDDFDKVGPRLPRPMTNIRYRGFVLCCTANNTVWIGIRNSEGAIAAVNNPSFSNKQCAVILRRAASRIAWRSPKERDPLPWFDTKRFGEARCSSPAVCRELAAALLGNSLSTVEGLDVFADGSPLDLPGPVAVSYATLDKASLERAFTSLVMQVLSVEHLVLWATAPIKEVSAVLESALSVPESLQDRPVHLVGREHLLGLLSRAPWVWSKHFGRDVGFQIFRSDDHHLADALGIEPKERDLVIGDAIPKLRSLELWPGTCSHLVGHPGTGKTILLYQLLRDCMPSQVVVTISTSVRPEWLLLESIINGCFLTLRGKVMFVHDGVDAASRHCPEVLEHTAQLRLQLAEKSTGELPGWILTYRTSERESIKNAFGRLFVDEPLFSVTSMDHLSRKHLRAVVHYRLSAKGQSLTDESIDELLERMEFLDTSLRTIAAVIAKYGAAWERAFPTGEDHRSRKSTWMIPASHQHYWSLALTRLSVPEVAIMRLLRCSWDCWGPTTRITDARGYFVSHMTSEGTVEFRTDQFMLALASLIEKTWIKVRKERIYSDCARLACVPATTILAVHFARWIIDNRPPKDFDVGEMTGIMWFAGLSEEV